MRSSVWSCLSLLTFRIQGLGFVLRFYNLLCKYKDALRFELRVEGLDTARTSYNSTARTVHHH